MATRYQRPVEVAAAEAEPRVVAFVADQPLERHFVNSSTLAEIGFGIELVAEPNRRAELNEWLTHKVRPMFEPRVRSTASLPSQSAKCCVDQNGMQSME